MEVARRETVPAAGGEEEVTLKQYLNQAITQ
jgi:hypothetical protein